MYANIQDKLERAHSALDAAEAHGELCGRFCSASRPDVNGWIDAVLGVEADALTVNVQEARTALVELAEQTQKTLEADDFPFQPLLPDDDAPMADRVDAVVEWCHGVLAGMAATGASPAAAGTPRAEVLEDLQAFAGADVEVEGGEEDEQALMEIVEYLRVSIQVLYLDAQSGADPGSSADTLH